MKMNSYNCVNPAEIHMTDLTRLKSKPEEPEDLIKKFKHNPDSFFPSIIPPTKP